MKKGIEIINDIILSKSKPKEKVLLLADTIQKGNYREDLLVYYKEAKDPVKGTCLSALTEITKENPEFVKDCIGFVIEQIGYKTPRVKWEASEIIAYASRIFPEKATKAIPSLLEIDSEKENGVRNVYGKALKILQKKGKNPMKVAIGGKGKISLLLSLITAATIISSCSPVKKSGADQFVIVCSFYPIYIATMNVARDIPNVTVINMTQPQTGCLHDYSLSPTDLITLEKAKVFVINGAGMESFMDKVIQEYPNLPLINASKAIKLLKDPDTGLENPHVWVSISGAISQLDNIVRGLCADDPDHAVLYQKNASLYRGKLETLREKMHKELQGVKTKDMVTFHEAFSYFGAEFNLNILSVIEREPGSEPSPKDLSLLIDQVNHMQVKLLFVEPQYSQKTADTIARETGATIYILDPVVTGDGSYDSYLQIMEQNLITLKRALF